MRKATSVVLAGFLAVLTIFGLAGAATADPVAPSISSTAEVVEVEGAAVLRVTVSNETDRAVGIRVTSPYGENKPPNLGAGDSTVVEFPTDLVVTPAGEATVAWYNYQTGVRNEFFVAYEGLDLTPPVVVEPEPEAPFNFLQWLKSLFGNFGSLSFS